MGVYNYCYRVFIRSVSGCVFVYYILQMGVILKGKVGVKVFKGSKTT